MEVIKKISSAIDKAITVICIILMAAMTMIVLIQVSTRFLPVRNPNWTEELSRYLMIYIAYLGASTGIKEWANVGVDFIITRLPGIGRYILNIIIRFAILVFWCLALYLSMQVFPKTGLFQKSASMGFPLLYAQCSIIIGSCLCIIQGICQIITYIAGGVKNA